MYYMLNIFRSFLNVCVFHFVLCILGIVIVDVINEVATDLRPFISSTNVVASAGIKITAYYFWNNTNLNWQ